MTTDKLIAGIQILDKYRDEPRGHNVGAEHDSVYAYATDTPVEADDLKRLVELGWFQEHVEIGDDDEFGTEHYNIAESWCAYV